eukprot:353893-Chlamydomonas_euryale.AAC.9
MHAGSAARRTRPQPSPAPVRRLQGRKSAARRKQGELWEGSKVVGLSLLQSPPCAAGRSPSPSQRV